MEKIRMFVENMFCGLPTTKEAIDMKLNVEETLDDKYQALINNGVNENEAFGIIVSEFGSMNEIRYELGINEMLENDNTLSIYEYHRKRSYHIALGIGLIILGFFSYSIVEDIFVFSDGFCLMILAIFVISGISILIINSSNRGIEDTNITGKKKKRKFRFIELTAFLPFIYLYLGFNANLWATGWMIIPVGAILFSFLDRLFES